MASSLTSLCEKPAGDVTPHDRWRSVAVSGARCEVSLEPSPPPEPAHTAGREGQRVSGPDGTGAEAGVLAVRRCPELDCEPSPAAPKVTRSQEKCGERRLGSRCDPRGPCPWPVRLRGVGTGRPVPPPGFTCSRRPPSGSQAGPETSRGDPGARFPVGPTHPPHAGRVASTAVEPHCAACPHDSNQEVAPSSEASFV